MCACVRALHVLAAKDIAAATSAVRVIRSPFEISVHSRIFVESSDRASEENEDRTELGRQAEEDECESSTTSWLGAFKA